MSHWSRRSFMWGSATLVLARALPVFAFDEKSGDQPFLAGVRRLVDAMAFLGEPFTPAEVQTLSQTSVEAILPILDRRTLFQVAINPEARVSVTRGSAAANLVEQGWRCFLVKVNNQAGATSVLRPISQQALSVYSGNKQASYHLPPPPGDAAVVDHWLEMAVFEASPMMPTLSGLPLEYQIVELYSRDHGKREASIGFDIGAGTQDLGFRNTVPVLFDIQPSSDVLIHMRDENGSPITGSLLIRDEQGRIYPAKTKRLAPDFYFQPQVYRREGETVRLPPGNYKVVASRGPEYLDQPVVLPVSSGAAKSEWSFQLERWINPAQFGWYSGDHHIHAAGCSHYQSPTEGVLPQEIARHIEGEGLDVGIILTWAPSYYYQKKFFEGKVNKLSTPKMMIRYDLEVSGFPSNNNGHLVLLRLTEQDYPGATKIEQWPSWALPIAKWAKKQGVVVGFAHTGWGMEIQNPFPSYKIPSFSNVGANEIVIDLAHDAIDFLSLVNTPSHQELNLWYHLLNVGYRVRAGGETDFPCISDERVGAGRSYAYFDKRPEGDAGYDAWTSALRSGRSYASDGRSHLMDFSMNGQLVGTSNSEIHLPQAAPVKITARVAARLDKEPNVAIRSLPFDHYPYWHIERSRIGATRQVQVQLLVNGLVVATKPIEADGSVQDISFEHPIQRSSWVALRIFPSSHTNPIFVLVNDRPIRVSRRSVQWCLDCVDKMWELKSPGIRASELEEARAAYDHARQLYRQRLTECDAD